MNSSSAANGQALQLQERISEAQRKSAMIMRSMEEDRPSKRGGDDDVRI